MSGRRLLPVLALLFSGLSSPARSAEGFYKDLFMDGGSWLTHRTRLYAAESLGLSMEYNARQDSNLLRFIMVSNPDDANGCLLYPDGSPRFRCIYTNGGDAGRHGLALGDSGRQRVRDFFALGGSYTGSCAGAYLASLSRLDSGVEPSFYHVWPGRTKHAGLYDAWPGNSVPFDSPLLRYDSFGGDFYVDSLYVNGGPLGNDSVDWPPGTEVLLRYDTAGRACHDRPSCWAWKGGDSTGRAVVLGTHPEGFYFGERLHLTKAVLSYALDGVAGPYLKGPLANGVPRRMDRPTGGDPRYSRVGDRQYHHFTFDVPAGSRGLDLALSGDDTFDLSLYLKHGGFAFRSTADLMDTAAGSNKTLHLDLPLSGRWYGAVECRTTVETYGDSCFLYAGRTDVLNGVSYAITASWMPGAVAGAGPAARGLRVPSHFRGALVVRLPSDASDRSGVSVYDASGRLLITLRPATRNPESGIVWRPSPAVKAGLYFIRCGTFAAKTVCLK